MTILRSIQFGDSASIDAFDRVRVSQPTAMLDVKLTAGIQATRWITATANNGGIAAAQQCAANLTCTADTGSSAILQTKQRGIYQAGRSLMALVTFNLNVAGNGTANIRKRIGMFDENDGVFLEQNGTDVRIVVRTNTTGTPSDASYATKANWNIDKFDGTGPSGITLDFAKTQIFFMDLEWLGVGRVRTGFVVNGIIYYAHQFLHANILTVPYMSNPNLPIRYECVQTDAANTGTLLAICSTILSEGGFDLIGKLGSAATAAAGRANLGAVRDEVLAIRIGSTFIRKGIVLPDMISILQATRSFQWELVLNPTLTGTVSQGSWSAITNSICEVNLTRTGTTAATGGDVIAQGFVSTSLDSSTVPVQTALAVAQLDLTPSSDVLSLMVQTTDGSDQTFSASIGWRELT